MNIDTLHKEGKSQRVITERLAVYRVLYQSILNAKLTGRKNWVGKVHKQQGWLQAWEYSQAKLIQTLVRASQGVNWSWSQCIKSHHAQTSSGKGLPSHFWTRDNIRSILPGLGEKELDCCSVVQSPLSDESKFCISFGNQGPRVWRKSGEAHNPCCLKSSVKFPQSVMIGLPCHLLVLVHCVSEVHSQRSHLPGHFRALHASFCWQALWRCWFNFPAGTWHLPTLPKVPKACSMTMVLVCLIGQQTRLTWTP